MAKLRIGTARAAANAGDPDIAPKSSEPVE
jgi:hypothetical protein